MGTRSTKPKPRAAKGKKSKPAPPVHPVYPWSRQEGEPTKAFEAFVIYRDMPVRSVSAVARVLGITLPSLSMTSKRRNWTDRVQAWDEELDRRLQEVEISELEKMKRRQMQLGIGMQSTAALELQALQSHIQQSDSIAKANGIVRKPILSTPDLVRLVEAGAQIERLNRGQPDSIVETRGGEPDLSLLTTDELKVYRELARKLES